MHSYYYDQREYPAHLRPLPRRKKPTRRARPAFWFILLVALLSASIILAVYFSVGRSGPGAAPGFGEGVPGLPTIGAGDSMSGAVLERAPTGDGTVLELHPQPEGEPLTYQEIYEKNSAAIVFISADGLQGTSQGTGVVMSADGYVLTNAHVIADSYRVEVKLTDETVYNALLVGSDEESDLAVLKLDAQDLTAAEFGDSSALRVGDVALAIGNPLGEELRGTMTDGIISAINRGVQLEDRTMVLIQTTAALNSGNSGGALLNAWGQVVGITNLKMSSWYESIEGLGFAIPTVSAKDIVDDLIAYGSVTGRPTIGITVRALDEQDALEYGGDAPAGLRVEEVDRRSDAWSQGLRTGDIIVEADGMPTLATEALNAIKDLHGVGDTLSLRVWREGTYMELSVALMERYELG